MRTWILTCAAVAAATIASALAAADEIDWLKKGANMIDWQNCRGDDADKINGGCTRIIEDSFLQSEAHAFAYLRRGMAWDEKGDRVRAIADYSESIRLNPKDDVAYGNRGLARHNSGDLEGAILDYTEAIHLDPEDADWYNNRGNARRQQGDLNGALMDGTEAVRLDPNSALAYHSRGLAWRDMGNLPKAIADYTESIRLDGGDALAYFNRGEAWQKKGDLDFAIDDFNQAITRDPAGRRLGSHLVGSYRNRGYALFVKGDFGLSAANLSKVMGLGGNSYDVLYWYLASSRFGDDAVAELKDYAARLDTKKWPYPIIELFLGRLTASELIQMPRNLGERCEAQFSIGEWHLLNGHKSAARGNLQPAVEACPEDFTERAAARAELRQLSHNEPIPR